MYTSPLVCHPGCIRYHKIMKCDKHLIKMPRYAKIPNMSSFDISPCIAHSLWIMPRSCKGGRIRAKLQAIRRLQHHCPGSRKSPVPKDSLGFCGPMSMLG